MFGNASYNIPRCVISRCAMHRKLQFILLYKQEFIMDFMNTLKPSIIEFCVFLMLQYIFEMLKLAELSPSL